MIQVKGKIHARTGKPTEPISRSESIEIGDEDIIIKNKDGPKVKL